MQNRRSFVASLALAAALGHVEHAAAEVFPSHPLTMIVPFPAGGPIDATARIVADGMRASLGQPVIIENVGGASGSIGTGGRAGLVHATLTLAGPVAAGPLTLDWREGASGARAAIHGTLNGKAVAADAPAP